MACDRWALPVIAERVDVVSGQLWALGALGIEEQATPDGALLIATFDREFEQPPTPGATPAPVRAEHARPFAEVVSVAELTIVPPWETAHPDAIVIDPGSAFGHGGHATTKLMIELMSQHVLGAQRVIDVGCGTGVLSVVAAKAGAHVSAIDNDPTAVELTRQNAATNQVSIESACIEALDLDGDFDVALANVTIDVHEQVATAVLATGATTVIVSGILEHQVERAVASYQGLREAGRLADGEWRALRLSR